MIEIYLIRHAETEYNRINDRIGGRSSHLHINETGKQQAQSLKQRISESQIIFDKMFCSTSVRAKETISFITNTPDNIIYSDKLEELSQGDWEGLPRNQIYTKERLDEINANNYTFKAPNGESQEEVERRMYKFIKEQIISKHKEGKFLVLTHGMSIKCFLQKILESNPAITYKITIDNASVTKLVYSQEKGWKISYINRHQDL
ncbi:histidine phosphatase family protein [Ornithobacterium rhinotracheale]|uniref:Histidine phosphatase family protein n=1 Tax=Ornithobacterium rhinotracheale TaxID=28251 RepID=A0A410JQL3_ORNRH|nr:histidine phosphatase family protein [Ornithobacterium rhinotracheale]QAR30414.1 histidine phosphatase family protein [Ornithobacterium rhinotracheale]